MFPVRKFVRVRAAWLAAAMVAAVFGCFVWPTPYRAVQLPEKLRNQEYPYCCYAARVNRFTSRVEVLELDGWRRLGLDGDSATIRATASLIYGVTLSPSGSRAR